MLMPSTYAMCVLCLQGVKGAFLCFSCAARITFTARPFEISCVIPSLDLWAGFLTSNKRPLMGYSPSGSVCITYRRCGFWKALACRRIACITRQCSVGSWVNLWSNVFDVCPIWRTGGRIIRWLLFHLVLHLNGSEYWSLFILMCVFFSPCCWLMLWDNNIQRSSKALLSLPGSHIWLDPPVFSLNLKYNLHIFCWLSELYLACPLFLSIFFPSWLNLQLRIRRSRCLSGLCSHILLPPLWFYGSVFVVYHLPLNVSFPFFLPFVLYLGFFFKLSYLFIPFIC